MIKDLSCLGDEVDQSSGTWVVVEVCDQIIAFKFVVILLMQCPSTGGESNHCPFFFFVLLFKKRKNSFRLHWSCAATGSLCSADTSRRHDHCRRDVHVWWRQSSHLETQCQTWNAGRARAWIFFSHHTCAGTEDTQRPIYCSLINMQSTHQVFERHKRGTGQKAACLIAAGSSQITRPGEEIPDSVGFV